MKRTTKKRSLIIIVVVALLWPIVAWTAGKSLIVRSEISRADAIVVLAGSSTYLERAHHAAELFAAGPEESFHGAAGARRRRDNQPSS